ncbi:MAG: polymer-forming cytoskeletal protein [Polyangiaceae bacterium]
MADRSSIGKGTTVRGNVRGDGDLDILGRVEGSVAVGGDLTIGETALVKSDVSGRRVVVRGAVAGNVSGDESLVLERGARVVGTSRHRASASAPAPWCAATSPPRPAATARPRPGRGGRAAVACRAAHLAVGAGAAGAQGAASGRTCRCCQSPGQGRGGRRRPLRPSPRSCGAAAPWSPP